MSCKRYRWMRKKIYCPERRISSFIELTIITTRSECTLVRTIYKEEFCEIWRVRYMCVIAKHYLDYVAGKRRHWMQWQHAYFYLVSCLQMKSREQRWIWKFKFDHGPFFLKYRNYLASLSLYVWFHLKKRWKLTSASYA